MRRTPRSQRSFFRASLALLATALLAAVPVITPRPPGAAALTPAPPGYWLVGGDGSVYRFGSAGDFGSLRGTPLARPVAGMAPTPTGNGYWLVGTDGGIFSFGDAGFHGSTGALKLNQPIVGMAATPSGKGYWFVAADGGIFSFGDAGFHGSTGALKLNKPIVGMAATPTGKGYWFVASDGGIFAFGDAAFHGSTGATKLNKPIVGMAATPTGKGYWFVAADGGIFNFGDASFEGSAGGAPLPAGIVVMAGVRGGPPGPGNTTVTTTEPTPTTTGPTTTGPTTVTTTTGPPPSAQAFQVGLVGDSGYNAGQLPIFDRVVDHMNGFPLAFAVHDGDFKDPAPACSDNRFQDARTAFNRSKAPFVYTPGDNEWMDCDNIPKPENQLPARDRLAKLRDVFFAEDESLGRNPMPLTTQRPAGYPENTRWTKEGVVFATLNAPGPDDNFFTDPDEANARRQANVGWLRDAFDMAHSTDAPAVMIIWHTNVWQPGQGPTWKYLVDELKAQTAAFGKPVVLVHGDTHDVGVDGLFRMDKGGKPGAIRPDGSQEMVDAFDLPNFTRVETYAGGAFSTTTKPEMRPDRWIRVTVDPKSPQVFTFATETAPTN